MFQTSVGFDMRAPDFGTPASELYAAALEMCAYADAHGVSQVNFQEHHAAEDGYLPTPFLMGAAAAACTKTIQILLGAVILPLHDPVKVAEQIAVLDLISGGRLHTALGAGYVEYEFKAFRRNVHDRGKAMDEGVEIILRALSGERFRDGDREVFVRPLPVNRPPRLYIGGGVPATARRAAKFGLGLYPLNPDIIPIYEAECRKLGREPGGIVGGTGFLHVSEDPEATWAEIAPHVGHVARTYAAWAGDDPTTSSSPFHGLDSYEALRASGFYKVVTPDECVEIGRQGPVGIVPLVGGLSPKVGWKNLELFATKVVPRLNKGA
jgi:alkanesulfonate monooxygenase SsuD/methylene tetrahydromethanopterin reductase-like flavin-dependent oxidoreductase (luciferase family)